ncbi:MAG TPA: porin family protein [Bdellovibrionota bacterium]|jgi:hypothetical protein|nr:porin family protein [Bdellovibrionota bacterium]
MKLNNLGRLLSLGLVSLAAAHVASAAELTILDAHLIGGWTGASVSGEGAESEVKSSKAMSYGLGVGIEIPLAESFGIVTGLDYVHRKFEVGYDEARLEKTVPTFILPVMARAWLGNAFYLQGGLYAAKAVGANKYNVVSGDEDLIGWDYKDRRSVDFGLIAGLGVNIAAFGKTGLYVQGQYLHGFSDSAGASVMEERVRDIQISTGVRIEI